MKPTTATTASVTTMLEWNQSCSLPRSSMTCIAPTQTTSSARPIASIGSLRIWLSRSRYNIHAAPAAARPIGTLM